MIRTSDVFRLSKRGTNPRTWPGLRQIFRDQSLGGVVAEREELAATSRGDAIHAWIREGSRSMSASARCCWSQRLGYRKLGRRQRNRSLRARAGVRHERVILRSIVGREAKLLKLRCGLTVGRGKARRIERGQRPELMSSPCGEIRSRASASYSNKRTGRGGYRQRRCT